MKKLNISLYNPYILENFTYSANYTCVISIRQIQLPKPVSHSRRSHDRGCSGCGSSGSASGRQIVVQLYAMLVEQMRLEEILVAHLFLAYGAKWFHWRLAIANRRRIQRVFAREDLRLRIRGAQRRAIA